MASTPSVAGSLVVPDSVRDPLGYYVNNTVNSRALIAAAVKAGVKHLIFSSTAAVCGNPAVSPVYKDAPLAAISKVGWVAARRTSSAPV